MRMTRTQRDEDLRHNRHSQSSLRTNQIARFERMMATKDMKRLRKRQQEAADYCAKQLTMLSSNASEERLRSAPDETYLPCKVRSDPERVLV